MNTNFISVADKKHLFILLQLLSFLQSLDAYEEFIRDQSYFIITFRVHLSIQILKFIIIIKKGLQTILF